MFDVGAAGNAILLICSLGALAISSLLFFLFTSHYFLVTVIDSSAGNEEVHYPSETFTDWWWKPLYCVWILVFWMITGAVLCVPLVFAGLKVYLAGWVLVLWFMYPLSVVSTLHTQNWLYFIEPMIVWRMLTHVWALAYVYATTLTAGALCGGVVLGMFTLSFWWMLPAAILLPAALLFYARTWGRFAWVSLNFTPRRKNNRRRAAPAAASTDDPRNWTADEPPTLEVQEIEEPPPPVADDDDLWRTDKKPYVLAEEPGQPGFQETAPSPAVDSNTPNEAPALAAVDDEDEWATDKKPYGLSDEPMPAVASATKPDLPIKAEADKPLPVSEYFDQRAKDEAAAKKKAQQEAETRFLPTPSKKTPTFHVAFVQGVGSFLLYGSTVHVWANLVLVTFFELLCVYMVVRFMPQ